MNKPKELILIALLSVLIFIIQIVVSFVPGIELVSLFLILYASIFPLYDSILVIIIFSLLEGILYGFGDWVFGYLWIFTLLILFTKALRPVTKNKAERLAVFGFVWAILFGIFFSIQHAVLYGLQAGYAYWLNGLIVDIIHAAGNYISILLLYQPLYNRLDLLYTKYH